MRLPTDLQILKAIYDRYEQTFAATAGSSAEQRQIYIPIDCAVIANELETDADIVFGRLYYYLDQRHRYEQPNRSVVHLFAFEAGGQRHCIHFPYLASVLADLRDQRNQRRTATTIAIISLAISAAAVAISLFR